MEVDVLNKRGFIDGDKLAVRLQKIFPVPMMGSKVQRIIFLIVKDLRQFSDVQILEFMKRER